MNCVWEEFDEPDSMGWRRVRCKRCGAVTGKTPHKVSKITRTCSLPGLGDHVEHLLALTLGVELARIAYVALLCRAAAVLFASYLWHPRFTGKAGTALEWLIRCVAGSYLHGFDCATCKKKIDQMDADREWCIRNVPEVIGWLRESAGKRGLPFNEWGAGVLVKRAIALSGKSL